MKWDKVIAYCQIAGALLGFYNMGMAIVYLPEISGFGGFVFVLAFLLLLLGVVSAILILRGKGGIGLSTIFWALQIPYISFLGNALSFYALMVFAIGIHFENGLFFRFRIGSSILIDFSGQSPEEYLAINLTPFFVLLLWAKMGAYNKKE